VGFLLAGMLVGGALVMRDPRRPDPLPTCM
jgi:hypothetical protein